MTIIQSIFLGIVQGLGEFLPISSSAHLIIAPWLFHFPDPGLSFDVALHFGTLMGVVLYFWQDWVEIFKLAFSNFQFSKNTKYPPDSLRPPASICEAFRAGDSKRAGQILNTKYPKNILWLLIIATIPGAIFGYLLESKAETIFRSPLLIAFALTALGLVLYLVDRYHTHRKHLDEMSWLDSLWVGLSQAVAVIPGVSRSGATITTGLFLGLNRESAARFSFLLSTPIIFGAAVLKLPHLFGAGLDIYLAAGMLSAAVSGYFAIKYLLKFVERASYAIFFWYRLALAALIVVVYFLK